MTAAPILASALARLREDFNTAFPGRDKASDGWIGDTAHQAETSDHNPDDTVGVSAGQSDADTIAEVRAIDIDSDLRYPGVTFYDVVKRLLATPADLARLKYIIYCPPKGGPFGDDVPTIWRRNNNWQPERYTGVSPHREHGHLSGYAPADNDNAPWSVAQMGAGAMTSALEHNTAWMVQRGMIEQLDPVKIPADPAIPGTGATLPNALAQRLGKTATAAQVAELSAKVDKLREDIMTELATLKDAIAAGGSGGGESAADTFQGTFTAVRQPQG